MKKVPTMTEQEKQELLDLLMAPETPEQEEARDLQRQKDFDETFQVFIDQHDFREEPTLQTKSAAAWTRKNIVLDSWNQFIHCEAKQAEFFGDYPEGKGFRGLYNTRRCDLALNFAHYFLASMKSQVERIDEDIAKENEQIELTK
tara:strand:- start:3419 stop:3853 length:435 start_codon:yes stop_codon:yes gene_type:complete